MATEPAVPTCELSVIIEWENALLSEAARAVTMLSRLDRQLQDVQREAEVLVLYDEEELDRRVIEQCMEEAQVSDAFRRITRLVPVKDQSYYDLKNAGAKMAAGRTLVFLDSDVVPQEGWLAALLAAKDEPGRQVVGSHVYIDGDSLYERAFCAGWFFHPPQAEGEVRQARYFFANSVAFDRELFLAHAFPPADQGRVRGMCWDLARQLREAGVTVWYQPDARVGHPPPNGFVHFCAKAFYQGHDRCVSSQRQYPGRLRLAWHGVRFYTREAAKRTRDVFRRRKQARLSWLALPAAATIVAGYWSLAGMGYLITTANRSFIERHFTVG